jgi:hypothetical protein
MPPPAESEARHDHLPRHPVQAFARRHQRILRFQRRVFDRVMRPGDRTHLWSDREQASAYLAEVILLPEYADCVSELDLAD